MRSCGKLGLIEFHRKYSRVVKRATFFIIIFIETTEVKNLLISLLTCNFYRKLAIYIIFFYWYYVIYRVDRFGPNLKLEGRGHTSVWNFHHSADFPIFEMWWIHGARTETSFVEFVGPQNRWWEFDTDLNSLPQEVIRLQFELGPCSSPLFCSGYTLRFPFNFYFPPWILFFFKSGIKLSYLCWYPLT